MKKIANFILGTIVCLTVLGIIMFFTLYISLIIANENPPSDDAMFRMIQKTYGVDVTQYSPDVLYKSYDTNIREDYWAMLLNIIALLTKAVTLYSRCIIGIGDDRNAAQ